MSNSGEGKSNASLSKAAAATAVVTTLTTTFLLYYYLYYTRNSTSDRYTTNEDQTKNSDEVEREHVTSNPVGQENHPLNPDRDDALQSHLKEDNPALVLPPKSPNIIKTLDTAQTGDALDQIYDRNFSFEGQPQLEDNKNLVVAPDSSNLRKELPLSNEGNFSLDQNLLVPGEMSTSITLKTDSSLDQDTSKELQLTSASTANAMSYRHGQSIKSSPQRTPSMIKRNMLHRRIKGKKKSANTQVASVQKSLKEFRAAEGKSKKKNSKAPQ